MKDHRSVTALILIMILAGCTGKTSNKENAIAGLTSENMSANNSDKIEGYYFHFTARCTTCKTIEASAKENLETLYPNQYKQGLITFQSLNLDDAEVKPIARKLGVSGQTLLLVKGNEKINITNEGFMYAVVKPEKFREVINEKVAELMTR